jgi:phosphatidylinositol alpha-1,6-mannosyltransferase
MNGTHAKRRILLVTNDLGPRAGGIETFILGLLKYLDGSDVVIYTSSQDGSAEFDRALAAEHGVVVVRDKSTVLLPTPRVNRAVVKIMEQYSSSVIWFGATAPLAWMAPTLRRNGAQRIVGLTHGHEVWWARVFPFTLAMRRMGKAMDVVTYLGEFTHNAIAPAMGRHPQYVRIAPGIDVDHFRPGAGTKVRSELGITNKRVVMCVGRLVHRKGQDALVAAMPAILRRLPETVLVLVGIGPREEFLRKEVARLGIEKSVIFTGRVQYNELPEYFQAGDLFVMPSRSRLAGLEVEGLGIVYLEASACGIPVIAGTSGGAPDAVLPGETGVLVDGKDVSAIADAVCSLLPDRDRLLRMGKAGNAWVNAEWSWDIWGKKFAELLNSH